MKTRTQDLIRYSMKSPGNGRASFALYKDVKAADGSRSYQKISDNRMDAINKSYREETQCFETCRTQVKEIIRELYLDLERANGKVVHNDENHKVLNEFWKKEYAHRSLVSEYTAKCEFIRIIESLGPLSIYSASRDEIQSCIDSEFSGNTQRRAVQRFTQILKFIGRGDIRLRRNLPEHHTVTYITESELEKLLLFIDSPMEKAIIKLCFYSGLRIGEVYALELRNFRPNNNTLRITSQIDRSEKRRHTKTRRERTAYLCPDGIEAFYKWVNATKEERATVNRLQASRDIMKKYTRMAFPDNKSKHLTFHALRHCYAIHLLSRGISMSLVAQSLGNSLLVCQQYYTGFELTTDSIEVINAIMKNSR